ncbi:MAG: hypothetical protein ISS61_13670 [Desulfobacteraceae bacterium]|nr:hypothetical protein [Desulfobacteraceae bacterium]
MELNTFGAALKFVMDLETRAIETFEKAYQFTEDPESRKVLLALIDENRVRKAALERLYNDSVFSDMDTGIFEPIRRLEATDYLITSETGRRSGFFELLSGAKDIEEKSSKFYIDLGNEIRSRLRGAARTLEKMAKKNAERSVRIESILGQNS